MNWVRINNHVGNMVVGNVAPLRNNMGRYVNWMRIWLSCIELAMEARIRPMARNAAIPREIKTNSDTKVDGQAIPYMKCAKANKSRMFGMNKIQPVRTDATSSGSGEMGVTL